jgi:hypothetical protein
VAVDWNLDERTTNALVDVLVSLYRNDCGGITTLQDMLVDIELSLDEELEGGA